MASVQLFVASTVSTPVGHKKAVIHTTRQAVILSVTSPRVQHTLVEPDWVQIPRLGQAPLMRKASTRLRQMKMDVILTTDVGNVESQLTTLIQIANANEPCVFSNWGVLEKGVWWITSMPITSETRDEKTDKIQKATLSLTFTQAPVNSYKKPTVTAPKPTKPTAPSGHPAGGTSSRPKTYIVKKGDTLIAIAVRFYGDSSKYRDIASANKIKNPNLIYPGQKLVLP